MTPDERSAAARHASLSRRSGSAASVVEEEFERRGHACESCGATDELVWHHRQPSLKAFAVSWGRRSVSAQRMRDELAKCALLCRPCHKREHDEAPARLAAELGIELDELQAAADKAGLAWHATA